MWTARGAPSTLPRCKAQAAARPFNLATGQLSATLFGMSVCFFVYITAIRMEGRTHMIPVKTFETPFHLCCGTRSQEQDVQQIDGKGKPKSRGSLTAEGSRIELQWASIMKESTQEAESASPMKQLSWRRQWTWKDTSVEGWRCNTPVATSKSMKRTGMFYTIEYNQISKDPWNIQYAAYQMQIWKDFCHKRVANCLCSRGLLELCWIWLI